MREAHKQQACTWTTPCAVAQDSSTLKEESSRSSSAWLASQGRNAAGQYTAAQDAAAQYTAEISPRDQESSHGGGNAAKQRLIGSNLYTNGPALTSWVRMRAAQTNRDVISLRAVALGSVAINPHAGRELAHPNEHLSREGGL